MTIRKLQKVINAVTSKDGDGVKIQRIAGRNVNAVLDPFLMLDEINSDDASDYIGGFPEHPHRGFETITYMKAGRMRHRDHMGNEGVIEAGDVQWMTAGRGVLHSEMPEQDAGLLHGFQLWLNLPADEKMKPAKYRDIRSHDVSELKLADSSLLRVIAGEVVTKGKTLLGPLPRLSTEPVLLDLELATNERVNLSFNEDNPALVYIYSGSTTELERRQMGVYSSGEQLSITAGNNGVGLLVLSGKPLAEPIVQYGPFVMNSSEQIERAIQDYQQGQLV
jgi:redox-sensitive bicupin YhaK (pirin superfamily)